MKIFSWGAIALVLRNRIENSGRTRSSSHLTIRFRTFGLVLTSWGAIALVLRNRIENSGRTEKTPHPDKPSAV